MILLKQKLLRNKGERRIGKLLDTQELGVSLSQSIFKSCSLQIRNELKLDTFRNVDEFLPLLVFRFGF